MKKKLRNHSVMLAATVVVVCMGIGIWFALAADDNIFKQTGLLESQKMGIASPLNEVSSDASYKIVADSFHVTDEYFSATVDELVLSGHSEEEAQNLAANILIEKYSLYHAAQKADCIVSDETVLLVIQNTQEGIRWAENAKDFYDFLDGLGMSEDDYWESQFDNVKIYESIAQYQQVCLDAYNEASQSNGARQIDSLDAYWDWKVAEAIASEHVQIAEANTAFQIGQDGSILSVTQA